MGDDTVPADATGRRRIARAVLALVCGAVIGVVQYRIVIGGMRAAAASSGLAGVGVGGRYAAGVVAVSVLLLALMSASLRLRFWGVAALLAGLIELLVALLVWPFAGRIGLHGDSSAILCIPTGAVATAVVGLQWPARDPR